MIIKCFLGFHKWNHWFNLVIIDLDGNRTLKELRTCKRCNTTDMFLGFKFVRTSCLIKFTRSSPYVQDYSYLGKVTLDEWCLEFKDKINSGR